MQAINHYLIIDKIKEAPRLVGGLELNEKQNSDERYLKAKVVSVGNEVPVIKKGDVIRYDKHAGHGVEYKGNLYYVIKTPDVVIIE
jgi:co-chaperonin GroES (HSP10)|tara:strand:+ start:2253 stop:2510 length:258 start_codon:yes stop_codon:yes gene_type:complete